MGAPTGNRLWETLAKHQNVYKNAGVTLSSTARELQEAKETEAKLEAKEKEIRELENKALDARGKATASRMQTGTRILKLAWGPSAAKRKLKMAATRATGSAAIREALLVASQKPKTPIATN